MNSKDNFPRNISDIFPTPSRVRKPQMKPGDYLDLVQDFIKNLDGLKHILTAPQVAKIKERYLNIRHFKFIYYPQHGSILLLTRQKIFMPITVAILFFNKLNSNAFTSDSSCYQYVEDPEDVGYYQIEQMLDEGITIQQWQKKLQAMIRNQFSQLKNKQKFQKSPYFFKKLVEYVISHRFEINQLFQNTGNSNIFGSGLELNTGLGLFGQPIKISNPPKPEQKIKLQQNNTINFNNILFPDVSSQMCYLIYSTIFGDKQLAKILLLSFKIHYLRGSMDKFKNSQKKQTINQYKNCLDYLIVSFKKLYNRDIPSNKEIAFQQFNDINKQIEKLYQENTKKQYRISTHQLSESIKTQRQYEIPQNIDLVKQYCIFTQTKLNNANSIGFVFSLFDKQITQFSYLNKMRSKLEQFQYGQYYWIFIVEKHFFSLANDFDNIKIELNEYKIYLRTELSEMHKVVNQYQEIMTDPSKNNNYSLLLKNQAYSHVYLIKFLAAAYAFQLYKKQMTNLAGFQIENYTIDINLRQLYANFTSVNFQARKALDNLIKYIEKNKEKLILFSLNNNLNKNKELKKLAQAFCKYYDADKIYLEDKRKALKDQIKVLQSQFVAYKTKYSKANNQLKDISKVICSCREQVDRYNIYNKRKIECERCKQKKQIQQAIQSIKCQKFQFISSPLPENEEDQYLCVLFQIIKQNTGGVMKLLLDAQVPIIKKQWFTKTTTIASLQPLVAYCTSKQPPRQKYYEFVIELPRKAQNCIIYRSQIQIYYFNYNHCVQIDKKLLQAQEIQVYSPLQWMINKSANQSYRQHMIYANLDKKKKSNIRQLQSLTMEQFKVYGGIRVCNKTQLIILSQAILSRNAAPTTFNLHQFQRLIMMNACGSASSWKPSSLDLILNAAKKNGTIIQDSFSIVQQSIRYLLQSYLNEWKFDDLYSLEINGVIIGLFSKLLQSDRIVNIVMRAFNEYQKIKKEAMNSRTSENRLRELYLLHSIMSCFSQNICLQNAQACLTFGKIIVNYRLNKCLLNTGNNSKSKFAANIKRYQYYLQNAVLKNIESVVEYFSYNLKEITYIIRQIDEGISDNCIWEFNKNQNYTFKGVDHKNTYQINFFEGIILKNGAQTSTLPQIIKENNHYIQIFGRFTDLEVYQEKNGAIRTRSDYSHYFEQEKDTKIFFEFCTASDGVKIRIIYSNSNNSRFYLLIPHQILKKQSVYVPKLYIDSFQCWLDEKENHLIFRKRKLKTMNKIGLVLMHNEDDDLDPYDGRIITKQFQNQPLCYLTSRQHSRFFQKLFISGKNHVDNKAIQALSAIENPEYILQTYSSGQNKSRIFWLHRCGLKFTYDVINKRLVSQNYQGYSIPEEYRHHQLLPWRSSDNVRCLIIRKHQKSQTVMTMHEYMMLLPNQNISKNGQIKIIQGQAIANQILCYDIHDSFMDIRSKARLNQLHLICLISSLNSSMKFKPFMMTNQQYCINLIRSCYNNQPLSIAQCGKILNLIGLCIELNLNTLLLCCDVLCKFTTYMMYVLSFQKDQDQLDYIQKIKAYLSSKNQLIQACKLIYRKKYEEGMISYHRKLNKTQIALLGINEKRLIEMERIEKQSKWNLNQSFKPKFQQKSLKGLQSISQSYHKTQKDIQHLKETLMQFFQRENFEDNPEKELKISLSVQDILSKQMLQDLKDSYCSYLRYNEKYERLQLTKQESIKRLIAYFTLPKQKCQKYKKQLAKNLEKINEKLSSHLDFLLGSKSPITIKSYTEILCSSDILSQFYPTITKQQGQRIIKGIKQWILLTLEIESISRVLILLQERPIDKIALFRQLQSPRNKINQKNYWVCFEIEMKIRIWLSQYDTYHHLRQSQAGSVSQLNMGEGKTQVIIPMIVLDNLYDSSYKNPICRVNILSSLFKQAEANYFRFFSVTSFRIPVFSWYFNRKLKINQENIHKLKFMIFLLKNKLILLMDRESCLSMVLKIQQEYLKQNALVESIGEHRDEWVFQNDEIYDIYDEVDALMTSKKSFVYSVGPSSDLPDARLRYQYARIILQVISVQMFQWLIDEKIAIIEQSYEKSLENAYKGGYPKGLRLKQNLSRNSLLKFRERLIKTLLQNHKYCPPQFKFYQNLNEKQRKILINYLIDETNDNIAGIKDDLPPDANQILVFRGLIAFGILEHCLNMRNGVDFGVPGPQHPKTLGVPYEAGDVPSKRSEFSHPDVSILVSFISYFMKGITQEQFYRALDHLVTLPDSAKIKGYLLWFNIILDDTFKPADVCQFKQINMDSSAQKEYLFQKYKYNRNVIAFWLINCVFPQDLRQFEQSITSSCFDIAYTKKSVGFSGTKDTRWLFPNYIKWEPSENDAINGTDGKMIHQMINNTRGILQILDGKQSLWERFCQQILELQDDDIGSIIDAGAILVGKSFQREIVPWIVKNPLFKKHKFRGITFCDENGKWKVYDTNTLSIVERGTNIPEHQTFVIFDEARTRGADIKMGSHVKAVLSLSPNMTKDKLVQAVGRLRKFGRHQQIYIMATSEILDKIKGLDCAKDLKEKIRTIINWTCQNSLHDNRHTLSANSKLGQIHFKTVLDGQPDLQIFNSSLKSLYSGIITEKSVADIYMIAIRSKFKENDMKNKSIIALTEKMQSYGSDYFIKSYQFDDVCERQAQFIVEAQKKVQNQHDQMEAIPENNTISVYDGNISTISFKFHPRLKFSSNFINSTRQFSAIFSNSRKELSNINFFLCQNGILKIITQREMCIQLQRKTTCLGRYGLDQYLEFDKKVVGKLKDMKHTRFIKELKLEDALTHAQFINGSEFFNKYERNVLSNLIKDSFRQIKEPSSSFLSLTSNSNSTFSLKNLEEIVSHFLIRRRTFQSKFMNSDLEKLLTELKSVPDKWFKDLCSLIQNSRI